MTKTYIEQVIKKLKQEISELGDNPNPHVKKEVVLMTSELQILEAVLSSLEGNHTSLRIYTL